MEFFNHLALGFGVALASPNLLLAFAGCVLGLLLAVLPGIAPVAAMALLLPATYSLQPVSALILLAALYFGAQCGSASAALLRDPLVQQARPGPALVAAVLGTFFAACVGTLVLALLAPVLTGLALQFGPSETFALMVLGLVGCVVLSAGTVLKALALAVLGLLLGLVGTEAHSGTVRFAFDIAELGDGIGVVVIAMGIFGYGDILSTLGQPQTLVQPVRPAAAIKVQDLWPTLQDFRPLAPAMLRGSLRSAGAAMALLALLAWGLPLNAVMALMLGPLTLHQAPPAPLATGASPALFWGLVASLWLVHGMLLVLNLPLVGIWSRLLRWPYRWLFPALVLVAALGAYTLNHSIVDIWLVAAFGLLGYLLHKLDMAPMPLLLGFVLAPRMEDTLRGALQLSNGDWSVFAMRPLSASLLLLALSLPLLVMLPLIQSWRARVFAKV